MIIIITSTSVLRKIKKIQDGPVADDKKGVSLVLAQTFVLRCSNVETEFNFCPVGNCINANWKSVQLHGKLIRRNGT